MVPLKSFGALVTVMVAGGCAATAIDSPASGQRAAQNREEMLVALETVAEVAAKTGTVCPGRLDAALQSLVNAMNDAPERAGQKRVSVPQGTDVLKYLETFAEMVARTPDMPPRRVMWLGGDALGRGVDEHSRFAFLNAYQNRAGASDGLLTQSTAAGLIVRRIDPSGPAAAAGVRAGDRIVSIEGKSAVLMHIDDVYELLADEERAPLDLEIDRNGEVLQLKLPSFHNAQTTLAGHMHDAVFVMVLPTLSAHISVQVKAMIEDVRRREPHIAGYVLDLRQNGGGLLDEVPALADLFIDDGVLFTQTPIARCNAADLTYDTYEAKEGDVARGAPIVLLLGPNTSSGAEMLAAVMMERGRAQSVGQRTFGDGNIQTVIPLASTRDTALKVTTSEFVTAQGRRIDGEGVTPTVEVSPEEDVLARAIALIAGK